jgi:DNA-directed RNA polymerase specialized sigma24 family protein
VDEVLEKLEDLDPRKSELVKLRDFIGMRFEEAATALGIAVSQPRNVGLRPCLPVVEMRGATQG